MIDTNIFLEVMLSQKRKEECKALLNLLKTGKISAVITDFSIYSIMILMYKFKKIKELITFLKSLQAYRGLYIYTLSLLDKIRSIKVSEETGLDIDDSIQYSTALNLKLEGIISFDKHFDGLSIPRIEPKDLLRHS